MSRPKANHSFQNDFSREDAVLRAESMFAKLDVNGDGDLTEVGNSQILGIGEKLLDLSSRMSLWPAVSLMRFLCAG